MLDHNLITAVLKKSLNSAKDFSELFFEHTTKTSITYDNGRIEHVTHGIDQGVGLRLIRNFKTNYGFCCDLTKAGLMALAANLKNTPSEGSLNRKITLKKQVPNVVFKALTPPQKIATEQKIKLCTLAAKACRIDPRITQAQVHYQEIKRAIQVANSLGELAVEERLILEFIITVMASDGKGQVSISDGISGTAGFEILPEAAILELAIKTSHLALQNLTAKEPPRGTMPVVLASQAGGTIIHEAVGHGLEADIVQDGLSIYKGKLGKKVASPLITVVDDATLAQKRGSYSFDDEGTVSQRTVLIENGVLKNYLCDRLCAQKLKLKPTGNSRRESYEFRPVVRMSNTMVTPGKTNPADIIKAVKNGLYIAKMGGGQVNTLNGDFIFEAEEVYLIKDGCLAEPVKKVSLTGNGPDCLKNVALVGSDLGFSIGTCGKDGQNVPVTDAIPTMLIPAMIVG